ncbi:MAG: TRAP transporter permease [Bacillota bacterium]
MVSSCGAPSQHQEPTERRLIPTLAMVVTVLAVLTSLFHLYMNSMSLMMGIKKNAMHLGLMLALCFLMYPASKRSPRDRYTWLDMLLAALGLSTGLYVYFQYDAIIDRSLIPTNLDYTFAVIAVLLVLEAARRAVGKILPVMAICFLLYAHFGYLFPGVLAHRGFTWTRILTRMYMTDEGIFGVTLMVSASYVFMFILFGAFLSHTGTAKFFNDFALAFAGRLRGGPAQVAVLASGMMGTISGSSQANVATTGAFTIPLMKQVGYKPYFAGAVEAAASTGGILMPPIMGAAAFIMCSFLGIPYVQVMAAGVIPALLYYFAIFVMVDLEARKLGLKGLPASAIPDLRRTLLDGGHLILPIGLILYLLIRGITPLYAAFYGLIATVACSWLRPHTRINLKGIIAALDQGARTAVSVAASCAVVGFIVGVVSMTGLGQVIAHNIINLSMNQVFLALFLVMISAMVLGMGLCATACYIITATVAAPALVTMGISPLAAHFFAFYYGTLSAVIPPVALTSYTAAGLAGANPTRVALQGLKLATAGLIIPYFFAYNPMLLMVDVIPGELVLALVTATLGIVCLGAAFEGHLLGDLSWPERLAAGAGAVVLIHPGLTTDLIGLALAGSALTSHLLRLRRRHRQVQPAA